MSWMHWYSTGLAILFAVGGLSLTADAQQFQPLTNVENFEFDYDWFRPLYAEDFIDGRRPNTGIYFTYDRMYMNVTRPQEAIDTLTYQIQPAYNSGIFAGGGELDGSLSADQSSNSNGDWTYGNRFELGYMTEEDRGWMFTAWKINNPDVRYKQDNTRRDESLNDIEPGTDRPPINPFEVPRVDELGGPRRALDYLLEPIGTTYYTLNGMNYYSFDLSRVWRWKPFHRGLVVESFAGPKYVRIRDHSDRADFMIDDVFIVGAPQADGTISFASYDSYVTQLVYTDNDMWGGQFGARTLLRRGRWMLTSDVRGFMMENFRSRSRKVDAEITSRDFDYTFTAGAVTVATTDRIGEEFRSQTYNDNSTRFVYGGELRLEGAFDVTEYVALRGGLQVLAFGDGVGRGVNRTDESFAAGGVTVGFTINR